LGKDGTLTLKVSMTDGTNAIMIGKLPIPVGVASTYCTAKLNSLGCLPAMSFSGAQSAASTSGFTLSASNVRNQKSGLLFYGVNGRAASAFQGGTLCVNAPIKRTPGTSSAGSALPASDCTGVYSIDMNAFATGNLGGSPLPELTLPGSTVDCQFWGRDPGFGAPNNTTLSDADAYLVAPCAIPGASPPRSALAPPLDTNAADHAPAWSAALLHARARNTASSRARNSSSRTRSGSSMP
jgi:hypothetical protein